MKENQYDLIIIGLGAAGLMAAANAKGLKTLALEKNATPGQKVYISGKGQCNFTHEEPLADFLTHYHDKKNFVKHSLNQWTPEWTRTFFDDRDLPSIVLDNGKVFPECLSANELIKVLMREARANEVAIHFEEPAVKIEILEGGLLEVFTRENAYRAPHIILATGGQTYPVTGSSGDGYRIARMLGHGLSTPHSGLAPIYHGNSALQSLAGISIPGAHVQLKPAQGKPMSFEGDLLFTHKGLSGPVILNNSRYMSAGDKLHLKLSPNDAGALEAAFLNDSAKSGKQTLKTWIRDQTFAQAIGNALVHLLGFEETLKLSECDKILRKRVVSALSAFEVTIEAVGDHRIAMVTAGGIPTEEVKGKTLESKSVPGLYLCGEVVDVDGETGGYNIQWAFSSALSAVKSITKK